MADIRNDASAPAPAARRPIVMAVWLVIAGVIGWWAAFQLTIEKFAALEHPGTKAACDFSVLVQCTANLDSWQGRAFGFPNPIIGLACWIAPIVVGMAILAGARFAKWFWFLFWCGFVFAFGFIIWLMTQSIYAPNLHTLCPWCMTTWAVVIPSFYVVTLHLFRIGVFPVGEKGRHVADRLMAWVPLATFVSYVIILLLAQFELNAIVNILQTIGNSFR